MSAHRLLELILNKEDGRFNNGFKELIEIRNNEMVKSIVNAIITDIPVSDVEDIFGTTLLHLAARLNNLELISFFINLGFNVNAKDSFGTTPLTSAFFSNHMEAVKTLLDANANLSIVDAEPILQFLFMKEDIMLETFVIDLMQRIKTCSEDLESMADLLVKVNCPLKFVVYVDDARLSELILNTPEYRIGSYQEIKTVLEHLMAIVDFEHFRVLWQSDRVEWCRTHVLNDIRELIFNDSLLDWEFVKPFFKQLNRWIVYDNGFKNFLRFMLLSADKRALKILLLECNVDVQIRRGYELDVLPILFGNLRIHGEDLVELVRNRSFVINAKSFEGKTALHFAVLHNTSDKVRLLLEMGADFNVEDESRSTPFAMVSNSECAVILLQGGTNLRIGENYESLILKKMYDDVELSGDLCKILLAQLAIETYQGMTTKRTILNEMYSMIEFEKHFKNCTVQLEELMEHAVLPSVTLFNILTGKAEQLAHCVQKSETISTITEWCSQRCLDKFYCSLIKLNLEKAYNVFISRCKAAAIIYKYTSILINYNDLVIDKIFGFLLCRDIDAGICMNVSSMFNKIAMIRIFFFIIVMLIVGYLTSSVAFRHENGFILLCQAAIKLLFATCEKRRNS